MGVELTCLTEDPQNVSVHTIAAEAFAKRTAGKAGRTGHAETSSMWISPSPVSIKMRLFCLPHAGGVANDVFGR